MTTPVDAPQADPKAPARRRLRRPSLGEASTAIGLIGGVLALVFVLKPGWQPRQSPDISKATVSDTRVVQPVRFRRYLEIQQLPIPSGMTRAFLRRRGTMVRFHYEIQGLGHKTLQLRWEVSNAAANDLVASSSSAYTLTPSNNDDAGDWSVWIPSLKKGHDYYVTVTIYQPQGPPYELKHFDSPNFRGLGN
jgi:hypothetical protein